MKGGGKKTREGISCLIHSNMKKLARRISFDGGVAIVLVAAIIVMCEVIGKIRDNSVTLDHIILGK